MSELSKLAINKYVYIFGGTLLTILLTQFYGAVSLSTIESAKAAIASAGG